MRVILVRHFKTVNNESRRIMGWGDAPPSKDWEIDLLEVNERIKNRDIRFQAIYSSDLGRARETAQYYAGKHGCGAVQAAPELNEVNYGELYQRSKQWVAENVPEYKIDPDFVFPSGESFYQMQRRSVDFVLSLQRVHRRDTLLLVAHAGVIRGLVCHFLGLDFAANLKRKVSHRYVGEFVLERDSCFFYDELGRPSGFVKEKVVEVPWSPAPSGSRTTASGQEAKPAALPAGSESEKVFPLLAV